MTDKRERWTDAADAILRAEWAKGTPSRQIAEVLHKSKNSVLGRAFRMGLDTHPLFSHRKPAPKPRMPRVDELGPHGCRFIPGEPHGLDTVWCEKPTILGSSYCAAHHQLCTRPYIPPAKKTDGPPLIAISDMRKAKRAPVGRVA